MARVGLAAFAALVAWLFLGGVLGVAGLFLTSHIPIAALGIFLAVLGGLVHVTLVVSNRQPKWWKVGLTLAVVLSFISMVGSTLAGDRLSLAFVFFLFSYYFVFGSFIFILIQKYFVIAMLEE